MSIFKFAPILLVTLAWPASVHSATVKLGASKDNSIYESNPGNSAGGAAGIFVGTNGQGSPRRGLIAFDVASQVPAGATITSAELTLFLGAGAGGGNISVGLHQLLADWGEGTAGSSNLAIGGGGQGFGAAIGDATWSARSYSPTTPTLWSGVGGSGDFDPTASASAAISGAFDSAYHWLSTPALVGDVQDWLDNPAMNSGWLLVNSNEVSNGTIRVFYSSEATLNSSGDPLDPTWRPTLIVTYVPEPSGAMLLLVGLLALGIYRRSAQDCPVILGTATASRRHGGRCEFWLE